MYIFDERKKSEQREWGRKEVGRLVNVLKSVFCWRERGYLLLVSSRVELRYESTVQCPFVSVVLHCILSSVPMVCSPVQCLCHALPPPLLLALIGWFSDPHPGLVSCLSNLSWWQFSIYNNNKKILWNFRWLKHFIGYVMFVKVKKRPFLAQKHGCVQRRPFWWAKYSKFPFGYIPCSYGTCYWEACFFFFFRFLCFFRWTSVAWETAGNSGLQSYSAWCRLCVLTHVGSCVPNYQDKSEKQPVEADGCRSACYLPSCLLFVVYTKCTE